MPSKSLKFYSLRVICFLISVFRITSILLFCVLDDDGSGGNCDFAFRFLLLAFYNFPSSHRMRFASLFLCVTQICDNDMCSNGTNIPPCCNARCCCCCWKQKQFQFPSVICSTKWRFWPQQKTKFTWRTWTIFSIQTDNANCATVNLCIKWMNAFAYGLWVSFMCEWETHWNTFCRKSLFAHLRFAFMKRMIQHDDGWADVSPEPIRIGEPPLDMTIAMAAGAGALQINFRFSCACYLRNSIRNKSDEKILSILFLAFNEIGWKLFIGFTV